MDAGSGKPSLTRSWVAAFGGAGTSIITVFAALLFGYNLVHIRAEFEADITVLSLAPALYGLLYCGLSVFWGMLADKFGVRRIIIVASCGVGVCLLNIAHLSHSAFTFVLLYALAGVFTAGLSMAVLPKLISEWFPYDMRGKGILPASVGGGIAGVFSGVLMPRVIEAYSWRGSFSIVGVACFMFAALAFLAIKEHGPYYLIAKEYARRKRMELPGGFSRKSNYATVLKMPITYLFGFVLILFYVYYTSNTSFEVAALAGAGFSMEAVGLFESLNTGATVVGQLIFSPLADKLPRRNVFGVMLLIGGVLYAGLYFIAGFQSEMLLFAYGAFHGLFVAVVPIYQNLASDYYPYEVRGTGPGIIATIALVGRFGGPIAIGAIIAAYGQTNSLLFVLVAGAALALGGVIVLLTFPKVSRAQEASTDMDNLNLDEMSID